jgi:hypothetical protein
MDEDEIREEAHTLSTLIDWVLKQRNALPARVSLEIYQPRGAFGTVQLFFRPKKNQPATIQVFGYTFKSDEAGAKALIVQHAGRTLIATRIEFPNRFQNLYILHTIEDYVLLWLANNLDVRRDEALANIKEVRFEIEHIAGDGSKMQRPSHNSIA